MNAQWHLHHPMPKNATLMQRVRWHRAHAKHCACRPIPPPLASLVNAMAPGKSARLTRTPRRGNRTGIEQLRALLSGGDRRSIAQSAAARRLVEKQPSRTGELAELTRDKDWLVALRALDLLEKFAHDHLDWVEPHKRVFIGPVADSEQWEIRLQVVRAVALFKWTPAQMKRVREILLANRRHPKKFVRVWAVDSLATMAERDARLRTLVQRELVAFEHSGSPALVARARRIRERMERWPRAATTRI